MMYRTAKKAVENMKVRIVGTLQAARESLMDGPVSLIILDNSLPDGKGADFALELVRYPRLAKIPVIIASDWPSPFMWDKASTAGVRCVVTKSEFSSELVCKVLNVS
ncbi:response regulator [Parasedimentitalea marina]|uniref:Response regulator n=2 Tax=Parasedimentitalea marina TaxID=2483033 RepID=A0A3T0N8J8_9RHOB|nr:response regulator [Parasedimentitalea marina]